MLNEQRSLHTLGQSHPGFFKLCNCPKHLLVLTHWLLNKTISMQENKHVKASVVLFGEVGRGNLWGFSLKHVL